MKAQKTMMTPGAKDTALEHIKQQNDDIKNPLNLPTPNLIPPPSPETKAYEWNTGESPMKANPDGTITMTQVELDKAMQAVESKMAKAKTTKTLQEQNEELADKLNKKKHKKVDMSKVAPIDGGLSKALKAKKAAKEATTLDEALDDAIAGVKAQKKVTKPNPKKEHNAFCTDFLKNMKPYFDGMGATIEDKSKKRYINLYIDGSKYKLRMRYIGEATPPAKPAAKKKAKVAAKKTAAKKAK